MGYLENIVRKWLTAASVWANRMTTKNCATRAQRGPGLGWTRLDGLGRPKARESLATRPKKLNRELARASYGLPYFFVHRRPPSPSFASARSPISPRLRIQLPRS